MLLFTKNTNLQIAKDQLLWFQPLVYWFSSVVVLGDESGYATAPNQKMKLAAIEGIVRETEIGACRFNYFCPSKSRKQINEYEIKIPTPLVLICN